MAFEVKELTETAEAPKEQVAKKRLTTYYTKCKLNIRKEATMKSDIAGVLDSGVRIKISTVKDNMGKLSDNRGWVCMEFVKPE